MMNKTKELTLLSIMAAFAIILVMLINIPLLPAAPFLKYDPGDIPILLAGFLISTRAAIAVAFAVAAVQSLFISSDGGVIGMAMHFLATASFVGTASWIYHLKNTKRYAFLGLLLGSAALVTVMVLLNILAIPLFLGVSRETVYEMLLPIVVPFNVMKVFLNSVLAWFVYKPISRLIREF